VRACLRWRAPKGFGPRQTALGMHASPEATPGVLPAGFAAILAGEVTGRFVVDVQSA